LSEPNPPSGIEKPRTIAAKKTISPARFAAFHILLELHQSSSAHSDDLLQSPRVDALAAQDRHLCTTLVMGVLRWQLFLDGRIAPLLTHKTRLDDPVRIALRLGAFQMLLLDRIPAHAAISESVELTKQAGHRFASGLVNAVLRKLAKAPTLEQDSIRFDPAWAHPAWLVQRWTDTLGPEVAQAICAYNQAPPLACVRIASDAAHDALLSEGFVLGPGEFLRDARRVLSGDLSSSPSLHSGKARIQDEGSQLIAELLALNAAADAIILDCCAAPGGKTAILAERNPHSKIVAMDISATRVARMRRLFQSSPSLATVECHTADATALPASPRYERILCDVPCSGTGTLARNPEIKARLTPDQLLRHQERQIAILQAALQRLKPGGELLYSTCSLEPEENEQVIEAVLDRQPQLRLIPVRQRLEELASAGILHTAGAEILLSKALHGDFLRITPGSVQTDGFFAAILTK